MDLEKWKKCGKEIKVTDKFCSECLKIHKLNIKKAIILSVIAILYAIYMLHLFILYKKQINFEYIPRVEYYGSIPNYINTDEELIEYYVLKRRSKYTSFASTFCKISEKERPVDVWLEARIRSFNPNDKDGEYWDWIFDVKKSAYKMKFDNGWTVLFPVEDESNNKYKEVLSKLENGDKVKISAQIYDIDCEMDKAILMGDSIKIIEKKFDLINFFKKYF